MKKVMLSFWIGVVGGIGAAIAALYYSPLAAPDGPAPAVGGWTLAYEFPFEGGLAFTHGGQSRLPLQPPGVPQLWEDTIRRTALSVFPLRRQGQAEPAGIASRISVPSERAEPVLRGAIVSDHWLVTLPGEGSFFVLAEANWWPFVKHTAIPVWYLGRPWQGPADYHPTNGPAPSGAGLVYGASGHFSGVEGRAVEAYRLERFSREAGPERLAALLSVRLEDAPAGTAMPDPDADAR